MQLYKVIVLSIQCIILFVCLSDKGYSSKANLSLQSGEIAVLNFKELSSKKEDSISRALSFFLSEGLSFVKNIRLVPNGTIQRISSNRIKYTMDGFQRIGKQIDVDYLVYGYYSVNNGNIKVYLNIFDIVNLQELKNLSLEGSLDNFAVLLERLVVALVGSFDFSEQMSFKKGNLSSYTLSSPKNLNYLNLFAKSHRSFINESFDLALSYAKKLESLFPNDLNTLFIIADSYFIQGDLSASLSYYKGLFDICREKKLETYFGRAALQIAKIYNKQGNYKEAIVLNKKVLDLSVSQNDLSMKSKALRELGTLYFIKGEYPLANTYYYQALRNDRIREDIIGEASTLFLIAEFLYNKGEYTKAFREINRVINIHKKRARRKELVKDYILLASIVSSFGDLKESLSIYKYAEGIAISLSLSLSQAEILLKKAIIMELRDRPEIAEEYVNRSFKIQGKYKKLTSMAYGILGSIHYNKNDFKKALYFYQKSLQLNKDRGSKRSVAKDYSNIGKLYVKVNDYKKGIFYYGKALEIRKALDDKLGIAITRNSFALIYINRDNDYEKALKTYMGSIAIMNKIGYKEGIALSYWMIGNIYSKKESYKEAVNYYIKCQNIFIELGNPNYKNIELLVKELYNRIDGSKQTP